jgi:hypothetical protein
MTARTERIVSASVLDIERTEPERICRRRSLLSRVRAVWGVVGDDNYRRVVEAEQALEAGFGE